MEINLAFGKNGLKLQLPDGPRYDVVHARSAAGLVDSAAAIAAALDAPIGRPPLEEMARGKKTAAISVCDITRPAPNRITLPPLLERLHRAGLKREDITICIATGLHRVATPDELITILGPEIAANYPIFNHDAKDDDAHREIGTTKRGTPVVISKPFLDADLHITLGFIEQHLMLGFSGGRKLIAPGLAHQRTIKKIHAPRFMREARAVEGSIDDNPLHAELLEIAAMERHDFMLDVTLTPGREISGVFAGEPVLAHAAGVRFMRDSSVEWLPEQVDAVITTAAGHPLDLTFYQTIKGVTAAEHIVKPGGPILTVSECAEGLGSPEYIEMLDSYNGAQEFLDSIADTPVVPDQWQLEKMALVARKHPLLFYTPGAEANRVGAVGEASFSSIDEAVAALLAKLPANARIAVIPEGPYAFARVQEMALA